VLTGFESAGGVIVAIISVTGVVNYLFIVGPNLDEVMLSTYGQLLFLKILLFAGMIVLATLNRFHLSPHWSAQFAMVNTLSRLMPCAAA
jgi:putative copper resistance protein D